MRSVGRALGFQIVIAARDELRWRIMGPGAGQLPIRVAPMVTEPGSGPHPARMWPEPGLRLPLNEREMAEPRLVPTSQKSVALATPANAVLL